MKKLWLITLALILQQTIYSINEFQVSQLITQGKKEDAAKGIKELKDQKKGIVGLAAAFKNKFKVDWESALAPTPTTKKPITDVTGYAAMNSAYDAFMAAQNDYGKAQAYIAAYNTFSGNWKATDYDPIADKYKNALTTAQGVPSPPGKKAITEAPEYKAAQSALNAFNADKTNKTKADAFVTAFEALKAVQAAGTYTGAMPNGAWIKAYNDAKAVSTPAGPVNIAAVKKANQDAALQADEAFKKMSELVNNGQISTGDADEMAKDWRYDSWNAMKTDWGL